MEIKPALTPAEWASLRTGGLNLYHEFVAGGDDESHMIIAALNDGFPDDDPRKITRNGIEAIAEIVARARSDVARVGPMHALWDSIWDAERQIAALRALLPPDTH